ncbi:MAG TPA: hypothetical protein VNS22_09915 [Geminicoccus sp.]|uniref:hypothetical protein n=1 Tax=Geminicoccus sp. TaxID=2024832 RepID=UPI002B61BD02|nr:hypothetical protein [Geminicoccus sp.]HWL68685.1 hypothetical protein [Geminicoccus sp.]
MTVFPARTVSVAIDRPWDEVNAYLSVPENFPAWASGLGRNFRTDGDGYSVDGPDGSWHVRFTLPNPFGVLDHDVTAPDGSRTHNAMRVIPNGDGCLVMFTLLRMDGVTEEKFAADAAWVQRDLQALKALLETAIA